MSRDPRQTPRPGDVLRYRSLGRDVEVRVTRTGQHTVHAVTTGGLLRREWWYLREWRREVGSAEVVRVAESAREGEGSDG